MDVRRNHKENEDIFNCMAMNTQHIQIYGMYLVQSLESMSLNTDIMIN